MSGKRYTPEDLEQIELMALKGTTPALAERLGRTVEAIYRKRYLMTREEFGPRPRREAAHE